MLALQIEGLKKTYKNGFEALKGIDLSVKHGDFLALLGPNGAGKSTTIGIITTLVNKSSGSVNIYGNDLDKKPEKVKELLGIVPQEFNFNPWSPVERIILNQAGYQGVTRGQAKFETERLLKELGLWDKRKESARQLSGGMKRRLMIARALVHKPKFLILDEPTAGVDIELRRSMWDFLQETNRHGTTIVLTTHYLEEAEHLCNHIAIINNGEIVEDTDKKTLLAKLNVETLVLDLAKPLSDLPRLSPFEGRLVDPITLEIDVCRENNVNDLFSLLSAHNIQVLSMRNKSNRLEELFVKIVGEDKNNKKDKQEETKS
jgi:ABC-2 type transport system ATP-binding protein